MDIRGLMSVTLFSEGNYEGSSVRFQGPTKADAAALGALVGNVSSLAVYPGCAATLYAGTNFTGERKTFTGDAPFVGDDFNDRTLSVEFDLIDQPAVRLWDQTELSGNAQWLPPGLYDVDQLAIGNDRARSVSVPPGWHVTLYEHGRFGGRRRFITADMHDLGDCDFLNTTSSVLVRNSMPSAVDTLVVGTKLRSGDYLRSPNRKAYAEMQPDGNLVGYKGAEPGNSREVIFSTGDGGGNGSQAFDFYAVFEDQFRLQVYRGTPEANLGHRWESDYYVKWLPGDRTSDERRVELTDGGTLQALCRAADGSTVLVWKYPGG
jgi:hypothetical protein